MSDLRLAFRSLAKSPGFTVVALLTVALGIGVNTSMFSALWKLMFYTPYPQDAELVRLYRTTPESRGSSHAVADFLDLQAEAKSFAGVAAATWVNYNLAAPGEPAERLRGLNVTADFFSVLGIAPEIGRTFSAEEDQPGKNNVVLLSHSTWQQHFGGDPAILGRQIRLERDLVTVVGVMPARFDFVSLWGHIEAWRPMAFSDRWRGNRSDHFLAVIARLKTGVSARQAQNEIATIASGLAADHPATNAKSSLRVVGLARSTQEGLGENLTWMIAGLGGFVLLIACANLANLQFARHATRAPEQAIRMALGATRARLVAAVLGESLLLAFAGGALGLLVALWCNDALAQRFVIDGASGFRMPLDFRALGFAFLAATATGLGFGLLPAWFASQPDVSHALKQGSRGATAGRAQNRLRHTLIVAEVALALVLLASAGFFLRGIDRGRRQELGWRADGLLTGYLNLRGPNYATPAQRRAFYERLADKLAALPGIEQAALGSSLPTWNFADHASFVIEGQPAPEPGHMPETSYANVSPGYFAALKLPLVAGRDFNAEDRFDGRPVAIVSETLARTFWPGENPLGKRLGWRPSEWREVVGVVRDTYGAADAFGRPTNRFQLYRPLAQSPVDFIALAVRSSLPSATIADRLRRAVAEIDPDQSVFDLALERTQIDRRLANLQLAGQILVAFAVLGLVLAAVGIYGVVSGFVAQRTVEIGIRMALGAQIRDVIALVLGRGLRLTLIGSVLGLGGAFAVERLLHAFMPALPPAEAATTAAVIALVLAIALLACWLPARRAARVDPMVALRAE